MKLPELSVRRPIFTMMIALIVIVLGLFSLRRLKIDLLPTIELPTLSVRTDFDGASPEVIESQVTQIIEEIIATVPGVEELTSTSREGRSEVSVVFSWGTDIDAAALDVQATLEDEINELPEDIVRPRVSKYDVNSFPVVILGISGNLDPVELTTLVENEIRYRFSRLAGVAQVDLFGGYYREVRVEVDPDRLKALGVPLGSVMAALRDANLDLPSGNIESGRYEITLRAPAQFRTIEDIRETMIESTDGSIVSIGQVGNVVDTYQYRSRIERVNGQRGFRVGIRKQADANTVEVSRAVLKEIEEVNREFPQLQVVSVINQGNFIERSIENVARSVIYGGGLAVLVLLFFLRNVRSTVVIAVAIPISIIATFALVYFGGLTLNLMTLGGLALGVGMMVDSSIVVLENIYRRKNETGDSSEEAAAIGAGEVGAAIIASTITTLVIFLPVVFVRGVSGILFKDLAYVIVFSLLCSLLVSLSLLPMLASKLLKHSKAASPRRPPRLEKWSRKADVAFHRLDRFYQELLRAALKHRWPTVSAALGVLAITIVLLPLIGREFLPPSDEGEVRVYGRMEVGTRVELVDEQIRKVEEVVRDMVPEMVASVVRVSGGSADIQASLGPAAGRSRSNVEIASALRNRLEDSIPGMEVRVWAPQGQFLLERLLGGGGDGFTVEIRGFEIETLGALSDLVLQAVADVPGVSDADSSYEEGVPQQEIRVDRDKAAALGLTARDVTSILRTAVAGSDAGNFRTEGNAYRILVQLANARKLTLDEVLDLTLTTPTGDLVALRNVVTTGVSRAPTEIDRKDQQRLVRVRVNVADRDLGSVADDVLRRLDAIPRPDGYTMILAGSFEEQQKATVEMLISMGLALLLVYMVLACQYESLLNPLVVMLSAPMAGIGVVLALLLTGTTFNLQSAIGCIMLGGIVVNNAILLVDQASVLHREGMNVNEAVVESGRRRLRPILMTSLTTILGLLPLALGIGEGADAQAPLARTVIGGLTASTLITLVLIPAVFSLVHSRDRRVKLGKVGVADPA
ncbi:MAG: efflux RND transporter permease subunit [Opitutaceae bacterium]